MAYKKLFVAVVVFFVLLISGVASFQLYQRYFLTPERIIQKAVVNLIQRQSVEYSGDIKMSSFTFRFSGASDNKEDTERKGWSRMNIKLGATVSTNMETRLIDGSIYFRLGPSQNTFIGKTTPAEEWVKLDQNDITDWIEKSGSASPSWLYSSLTANETQERLLERQKLFEGISLFETIEELKNVQMSGVENRHFSFTLNKDQLKEAIIVLRDIKETPYSEDELDMLDQQFAAIETLSGEIWIGEKDMLPRKIIIKSEDAESDMIGNVIEVAPEEMTPDGIAKASGKKAKTPPKTPQLQLTVNLKNFDKPVKTSVPKHKENSHEEVEKVLSLLFPVRQGNMLGDEARDEATRRGTEAARAVTEKATEARERDR